MDKNAFLNDLSHLVKKNDSSRASPKNYEVQNRIDEPFVHASSKVPSHTLRKPEFNNNRKGMPQKFVPSQIIVDEEYLLT